MINFKIDRFGCICDAKFCGSVFDNVLKIPTTVDGIIVREISRISYSEFIKHITEIIIPKTVQLIDAYAFKDFVNLNKVNFEYGSQLKLIGAHAFEDTCIENININSVNTLRIDTEAFYNCIRLKSVELPDTLISIGNKAFAKTSLSYIDLINVKFIGEMAFSYSLLKNIEINPYCEKISKNFLKYCPISNETAKIIDSLYFARIV